MASGSVMEQEPAARRQIYSAWTDFSVLEELATAFFVADFSPGSERILWANGGALRLHWNSAERLEEFNRNHHNFVTSRLCDSEIHEIVQIRSRIHHAMKTVSLGGVEVRGKWTCRPCRVELPDEGIRELVLVCLQPCQSFVDTATADALLSYTGVLTTMFEYGPDSTKYAVYQNEKSRAFYHGARSLGQEVTHDRKRVLCLQDVLDSCHQTDSAQLEEMTQRLRNITADDGEISFSCRRFRVDPTEDEEELWFRMSFRCITSPFTSDAVILLNEYDVTAEAGLGRKKSSALQESAALNGVLASVSGELSTPLNGIIGLSESLLQDPRCSVQMQRSLTAIKDGGMRLARLVGDVVDGSGSGSAMAGGTCAVCGNSGCTVSEMERATRTASFMTSRTASALSASGLESIREGVEEETMADEVARMSENNANLRREVVELQQKLEETQHQMASSVERARLEQHVGLERSESEAARQRDKSEQLAQRCEELLKERARAEERQAELQDQLAGAQLAVEQAEDARRELQKQQEHNEDLEFRVVELHGKLVEASMSFKDVEREKMLLTATVADREQEVEALRAELDKQKGRESEQSETAADDASGEEAHAVLMTAEEEAEARKAAEMESEILQRRLSECDKQLRTLEAEVGELRAARAEGQDRGAEQTGRLAEAGEDARRLQDEYAAAKQRVEELLGEAANAELERGQLVKDNTELNERAARLEEVVARAKAAMQEELEELDRTREEVVRLERCKAEVERVNVRLEETVEQQRRDIVQGMEEMGNAAEQNQRLKLENDELWAEIESRSQQGEDDEVARGKLEKELAAAREELVTVREKLEKELADAREELGALQAKRAAGKLEKTKLERRVEELQGEHETSQQSKDHLLVEAAKAQSLAREEAKRLEQGKAELEGQVQQLQGELQEARRETEGRFERALDERRQLQQQNASLVTVLDEKSARVQELQAHGAQLQGELDALQVVAERTRAELQATRSEADEVRAKLEALETERGGMTNMASRVAGVEADLLEEAEAKRGLEEKVRQLSRAREEVLRLERSQEEAEGTIRQLRDELRALAGERVRTQEEVRRLQREEDGRQREAAARESRSDAELQGKLQQAQRELKEAREELGGVEAERAATKEELAALERRVEDLQLELEGRERVKERLEKELQRVDVDNAELRKEIADRARREEGDKEQLGAQLGKVRAELAAAQQALQSAEAMNKEGDELRQENAELERRVQELQAEAAEGLQALEEVAFWKDQAGRLEQQLAAAEANTPADAAQREPQGAADDQPSLNGAHDATGGGGGVGAVQRKAAMIRAEAVATADEGRWPMHSEIFGSFEVFSVDDTSVNHMVVESALKPRGLRVNVCLSGEEALEKIEKRGYLPDCMLVDCLMPGGMDGFETCRRIRELYPDHALPLIMVSGKGQEQDVADSMAAGCSDYVVKPFTVSELNEHVDAQLKFKQVWMLEVQRLLVSRSVKLDMEEEGLEKLLPKAHSAATVLVCNLVEMGASAWRLPGAEFAALYNALLDAFERVVAEEGAHSAMDDCFIAYIGEEAEDEQAQAKLMLGIAKKLMDEAATVSVPGLNKKGVRVQIGLATGELVEAAVGVRARFFTYQGEAVHEAWEALLQGQPGCITATERVQQALSGQEELLLCAEREAEGSDELVRTFVAKHGPYTACVERLGNQTDESDDDCDDDELALEPRWTCNMRGFLAGPGDGPSRDFSRRRNTAARSPPAVAKSPAEAPKECSRCAELEPRCAQLEQQLTQLRSAGSPKCTQRDAEGPARPSRADAPRPSTTDVCAQTVAAPLSAATRSAAPECAVCAARRAEESLLRSSRTPPPAERTHTPQMPSATPQMPSATPDGAEALGIGAEGLRPSSALRGRARIREGARRALAPHMLAQADMHMREMQMREALHQRERNALHGLTHSLLRDIDSVRASPLFSQRMPSPSPSPGPPVAGWRSSTPGAMSQRSVGAAQGASAPTMRAEQTSPFNGQALP